MSMTRRGFLLGSAATLQYKRLVWMTGLCQFIAQPTGLTLDRLRAVAMEIRIDQMRHPHLTVEDPLFVAQYSRYRDARVDISRVMA